MRSYLTVPSEPIATAEDMERFGRELAQRLGAGDVLALIGPLGAGKTTLVRGLAQGLGIDPERVASPTFALCHTYRGGDLSLVHLDLYRIANAQEAIAAGLEEQIHDPEVLVVVEWPERAAELFPPHTYWLRIEPDGDKRWLGQPAK